MNAGTVGAGLLFLVAGGFAIAMAMTTGCAPIAEVEPDGRGAKNIVIDVAVHAGPVTLRRWRDTQKGVTCYTSNTYSQGAGIFCFKDAVE